MKTDDSTDPDRVSAMHEAAAVLRIVEANEIPIWPRPTAPMAVARKFLAESYQPDADADGFTLRSWRGNWVKWERGVWTITDDAEIQGELYAALEEVVYFGNRAGNPTPRKPSDGNPTPRKISDGTPSLEPDAAENL